MRCLVAFPIYCPLNRKSLHCIHALSRVKCSILVRRLLGTKPAPESDSKEEAGRILTLPNVLTLSRLALSPTFPFLVSCGNTNAALAVLIYCGATDLVDGWIARKFRQASRLGSVLDPVADKVAVLIFSATLILNDSLPLYLAGLYVAKDMAMLLAGMYIRHRSLRGSKLSLQSFFNPSVSSVEIKPLPVSKLNTVLQFVVLGSSLLPWPFLGVGWQSGLEIASAATTILSGLATALQYKQVVRRIKDR